MRGTVPERMLKHQHLATLVRGSHVTWLLHGAAEAEDEAPKEAEAEEEPDAAGTEAAVAAAAVPVAARQDYSKQQLEHIASSRNQVRLLQHG